MQALLDTMQHLKVVKDGTLVDPPFPEFNRTELRGVSPSVSHLRTESPFVRCVFNTELILDKYETALPSFSSKRVHVAH